MVHHEQPGLVVHGFDLLYDLMVCLFLHVNAIHCNHTVPGAQPRRLCWGAGLHFADKLSALPFLAMQVKTIPVLPF